MLDNVRINIKISNVRQCKNKYKLIYIYIYKLEQSHNSIEYICIFQMIFLFNLKYENGNIVGY